MTREYRTWSRDQKIKIVKDSYEIGIINTAEKYTIVHSLIYKWRKEFADEIGHLKIKKDKPIKSSTSSKERQSYSIEEKKNIIKESLEFGVFQTAKKYKVHINMIYRWRKKFGRPHAMKKNKDLMKNLSKIENLKEESTSIRNDLFLVKNTLCEEINKCKIDFNYLNADIEEYKKYIYQEIKIINEIIHHHYNGIIFLYILVTINLLTSLFLLFWR